MNMSSRHLVPSPVTPEPASPVLGPDGLYDRVSTVEAELCVYDHEREKGKSGLSFSDALNRLRKHAFPVNVTDDVGTPIKGQTIPGTARVDGPLLFAMVHFELRPTDKVEKLFKVRSFTDEQLAEFAAVEQSIANVDDKLVVALFEMHTAGAGDDQILAHAKELGIGDLPAKLLLECLRVIKIQVSKASDPTAALQKIRDQMPEQSGELAEAVKFMARQPDADKFLAGAAEANAAAAAAPAPAAPEAIVGGAAVEGRAGVNARITGECVAKLSPDGSVG